MSEKSFFGSFERLGHGLLELAVGIGALALGIRFFKESFTNKKGQNDKKDHR